MTKVTIFEKIYITTFEIRQKYILSSSMLALKTNKLGPGYFGYLSQGLVVGHIAYIVYTTLYS